MFCVTNISQLQNASLIAALGFGVSHSLGYVAISFGLTYLIKYFGNYGLWIYITPILIAYTLAIKHLSNLEKKRGAYDNYPYEDSLESELAQEAASLVDNADGQKANA